jgi:subtilase family serine protease
MASSGDSGGLDCPSVNYLTGAKGPYRFLAGVETPADSSYVTAVGGTNLVTTAPFAKSLTSVYVSENANGDPEIPYDPFGLGKKVSGGYWGAGGGVSQHFAKPAYQNLVPTGASRRALPDIGMQVGGCPAGISKSPCGSPRSSVFEYLGGQLVSVIGTSVASPEFAGVAALLVQRSGGRVGNLNTYIYTQAAKKGSSGGGGFSAAQYYHRDIPGFDGLYHAAPNKPYNFITGTGTPNVHFWLGLPKFPVAGNPQTPSNP